MDLKIPMEENKQTVFMNDLKAKSADGGRRHRPGLNSPLGR
jgi:hypothetical protein